MKQGGGKAFEGNSGVWTLCSQSGPPPNKEKKMKEKKLSHSNLPSRPEYCFEKGKKRNC